MAVVFGTVVVAVIFDSVVVVAGNVLKAFSAVVVVVGWR